MKAGAQVISYLFHPLLLSTYLVLVLGWFMPRFLLLPPSALYTFTGLVFVMTFVLPAANLFMFKTFGTLPSLHMRTRQERVVPFTLITIIYAVVAAMFFYKVTINVNFNKVMLIIAVLVLVATLATLFIKISVHSMAMAAAVGIMFTLNKAVENGVLLWPTLAVLTLAGLVMSARLYLNAHTPREVLYGSVTGFSIGFFGMILLF